MLGYVDQGVGSYKVLVSYHVLPVVVVPGLGIIPDFYVEKNQVISKVLVDKISSVQLRIRLL